MLIVICYTYKEKKTCQGCRTIVVVDVMKFYRHDRI